MTSIIGAASSISYASLFSSSSMSNWIADTMTAIQNQRNQGGLLGMLQNAGDGSLNSVLRLGSNTANALATISQTSVTNTGSLYAQIATSNQKLERAKKLQESLNQLAQPKVQPKNVLNPVLYFPDGSTIDTVGNILTRTDGTQYDITTGARYVDPASIIQMANGAYLNTKTNIMTLPDGTQIDTVTGLKVSVTA